MLKEKRMNNISDNNDWTESCLSDIALINPRETIKKGSTSKSVAMEKLVPYCRKVDGFELKAFKGGTKFRNQDTLLARITPCLENGKTAYVDILEDGEVGFGSTEYIVIRPKKGLSDSKFLYYFSISPRFREEAIKLMTGTSGRQRVQTDQIVSKNFAFPKLPEQKAIASVLTSFDDKIELLRQQNQTLEEIAQTLFKEWFVDFRFPGVGKMIDSELGLIPEGWKVGKIGELIEESISGDWGKEEEEGYFTEKVTCLRGTDLEDIKSGATSRAPIRYIKPDKFKKSELKPGDIVIEISGGTEGQSTGRTTYINEEILESFSGKAICVNFCRTLRPQSGTTFFVFEYLSY
jgi:type I restriction enzyme S subunit